MKKKIAREERRKAMDKFAVVEEVGGVSQEELEKQAMRGCPKCGGRVERHGRTLTCANCGTEPFEAEKA
jgi:tRNA(Ile2) C34 agmatinyltransferase TiaS